MGRITGSSNAAADHEQQPHEIQSESNPQNEVVEYDQDEQQIPTTTSSSSANHPQPPTAFSPSNPQTTAFSPANPPPAATFSPANPQPTTAFSPANPPPTAAFSPGNPPPTTAFYQANPLPTTASFSPGNPPPTTSFYQANPLPTTAAFSPANPPPATSFYNQANTHSTMPAFFSPNNAQQFSFCPPPQEGYPHSCGDQVGGNYQPPAAVQPQPTVGAIEPTMGIPVRNELWTTGLFDCWEDPFNALITAFLPCVTYGQIAEIIDNGQSSCAFNAMLYICILHFIGLPCLISCTKRTQMRNQYGLVELPAPDWIVHLCCESCALCQEYRELQNRGIDPSIGWAQNVARRQVVMMPPMNQRMMGR